MYHYLEGQLVEKSATSMVIDVNGIGFQLQIPLSTYEQLPSLGQSVRILTHFVVREDCQALYGFYSEEERQIFRLLISISGIGPKSAVTVLSGIPVPELKSAIVDGSVATLQRIAGIGKKTAERIVIELREKIVLDGQRGSSVHAGSGGGKQTLIDDSVEALVALGYRKQNAKVAIEKAMQASKSEKLTVEELIRASLKFV
ncbi:MAG: Holliday junction branch migration protein RuvA [Candidatus Omnitrophica bacterium]|nr:Holliday junction branch migration protein RuvA [Candidatus Omnitrophota bacterium]MDD5671979.1 Holliday junction branch migration protein RuvA [Candidatus Omnitrophota bacterium]